MTDADDGDGAVDVLLVEDNPGDVRLTKEAFGESDTSLSLHVVSDGTEALEYLHGRGAHADAPRPDVVLLDLNLPGKNGEDVLAAMDDDEALARIPVVVLTSSEAAEDVARSYDLRANAYLTKPVDPEAFIETIRSFESFWLETATLPPAGGR